MQAVTNNIQRLKHVTGAWQLSEFAVQVLFKYAQAWKQFLIHIASTIRGTTLGNFQGNNSAYYTCIFTVKPTLTQNNTNTLSVILLSSPQQILGNCPHAEH